MLKASGIAPASERPSSWKTFLKAHCGEIAGTDFLSTEVWTLSGIKTYYILFVIDLKTRSAHIAGITTSPDSAFVAQVARNLTDFSKGLFRKHRFSVCDRDTKFTQQFKRVLGDFGVKVVLTPVRAPNCNAHAEGFVGSIKSECLNRMIFFGERSLVRAVSEFIEHYHAERPHQGIGNEWIEQRQAAEDGEVVCDERLGGILKHYRRAA